MADRDLRCAANAEGKYYVDETCIAAKYCVSVAPQNFQMDESGGHAIVKKQPEGATEEEQVRDAVNGCPVNAIGDDGAD